MTDLTGKRFAPKSKSRQDEKPLKIMQKALTEGFWIVTEEGDTWPWQISEKLLFKDFKEIQ